MDSDLEAFSQSLEEAAVTVSNSVEALPPQHMILNDLFTPKAPLHPNGLGKFSTFSLLPPEIRLQIWNECMLQPSTSRFISLALNSDRISKSEPRPYKKKNSLGNVISSHPYYVLQDSIQPEWFDVLDQVNHEARNAYRRRYRLRFPLSVKSSADDDRFRIVHLGLDPETDIIHLGLASNKAYGLSTIHCIYDLIAYDPNRVGVAHLAIEEYNHLRALTRLDPNDLPLAAREVITKWLSDSLESFYTFLQWGNLSRVVQMIVFPDRQAEHATDIWHCNRSIPIISNTTHYSRITKDMRPIQNDLAYIAAGEDPRKATQMWNQFRANFGKEKKEMQLRYLIGISARFHKIVTTRQDSCYFLDESNTGWEKIKDKIKATNRHQVLLDADYKAQCTLPQVAGLWNLPADTFGKVPPLDAGFTNWNYKYVFDKIKYRS